MIEFFVVFGTVLFYSLFMILSLFVVGGCIYILTLFVCMVGQGIGRIVRRKKDGL